MLGLESFSTLRLTWVLLVVYALHYIHWELTTGSTRRRLKKQHGCQPCPRYPLKDPILGLDYLWGSWRAIKNHRLLQHVRARYQKMGNTFQTKLMGETCYATIEPENCKAVLSTSFKDFKVSRRRSNILGDLLGPGIFVAEDAEWQHSRAMLRPNFSQALIRDLRCYEHHVALLIQNIGKSGYTVDLMPLFMRLATDTATELLFGESAKALDPSATEYQKNFYRIWNRALTTTADHGRYGIFRPLVPEKQYRQDIAFINRYVERYVKTALEYRAKVKKGEENEKTEGRYVFLQELAKQTSDPARIRSELLNIFAPGRDTTATLLSNVWFMLSRRPDIWAKLRQEVDQLGGEYPTYTKIAEMKYLRALLHECMVHPIFHFQALFPLFDIRNEAYPKIDIYNSTPFPHNRPHSRPCCSH